MDNLTERDLRGVCYRPGKPTLADYDEAIRDLQEGRDQIASGSLMGCDICGDSGHAPQDAICLHDPLLLARQWTAATSVWCCYHCGYVATNDAEAKAHFGRNEFDAAACLVRDHLNDTLPIAKDV
jgi:hypothetical protein